MRLSSWSGRSKLALASAVAVAIVAGTAYATIPDNNHVYTACMLSVGTIRLIDPSGPSNSLLSHCTSLETQISWNQQGQPGEKGAQGDPGQPGQPGAAGSGLASLSDLTGLPCVVRDAQGHSTGITGTTVTAWDTYPEDEFVRCIGPADQYEPNNTRDTATDLGIWTITSGQPPLVLTRPNIVPATDTDWYKVELRCSTYPCLSMGQFLTRGGVVANFFVNGLPAGTSPETLWARVAPIGMAPFITAPTTVEIQVTGTHAEPSYYVLSIN